jgi:hypothetical protein
MATARVISETDVVPDRAAGYRLEGGAIKNQRWVSPSLNTTADGSLYFSVSDLIAWEAGVRRRSVLKPASWDLILQPVRLASGKTYPYGFGWFLEERNGQPLQQHGGAWQGFKTQFSRFVGQDLSIIVLANLAQAIADRDPQVTARLARLLDEARSGGLTPTDFAYVRAGFFPGRAKAIQDQLRTLGVPQKLVLVERVEKGDDRIFTYEVTFESRVMYYTVAVAPDNRISLFELRAK